ncbi:hypothetical protein EVAR_88772_1 [Eumeta japonica]|uniref:Uncharacterized protein n=1 Tax=Eumeta variegata TaxID=151549 RepID=A0A4C1XSH0_EUMVA|nr:hypothetical protein EVAR_88772_1 [Eumeta japonica]
MIRPVIESSGGPLPLHHHGPCSITSFSSSSDILFLLKRKTGNTPVTTLGLQVSMGGGPVWAQEHTGMRIRSPRAAVRLICPTHYFFLEEYILISLLLPIPSIPYPSYLV